jgi:hypothetical protein
MHKLIALITTTVGSAAWLVDRCAIGIMTAFVVSMVGFGAGLWGRGVSWSIWGCRARRTLTTGLAFARAPARRHGDRRIRALATPYSFRA